MKTIGIQAVPALEGFPLSGWTFLRSCTPPAWSTVQGKKALKNYNNYKKQIHSY